MQSFFKWPLSPSSPPLASFRGVRSGVTGCQNTPSAEVLSSFSLHLILKMTATSGFLTALECTKFVFGGGAYSATPDPLAGLRGPTSKGRGEEGKERKGIGEGKLGRRKEREGEGKERLGERGRGKGGEGNGREGEEGRKDPSIPACLRPGQFKRFFVMSSCDACVSV